MLGMDQRQSRVEKQLQEMEDHTRSVLDQQIRVEGQIRNISERQSSTEDMLRKLLDHLCKPGDT